MKTLFRLVAIAIIAVPSAGYTQMQPPSPLPPRINTSGEGQVRVTPDRATVFIGVQSRALTAGAAAADNAKRQKAILDTLKALGLGPDQLATQNYSVSPEMKYEPTTGNGRVVGYVVSNTVRAELKRIDQVGAIIDAGLAKGANQIGGVQFSVSNAAEARRTAMAEAVANAKADAEVLARAAGGSLGQLIEIASSSPMIRPMYGEVGIQMRGKTDAAQTPIEPGEQTITANVSAVWQFIPGSGR